MARAAQAALARQRFVSAIDVLLGLGWLAPSHVDQWRQGRVDSLEQVVQANLSKITAVMAALRRWARDRGSTRRRPITSLALGPPSAAVQRHRRGRHRARVSHALGVAGALGACGRAAEPAPRFGRDHAGQRLVMRVVWRQR